MNIYVYSLKDAFLFSKLNFKYSISHKNVQGFKLIRLKIACFFLMCLGVTEMSLEWEICNNFCQFQMYSWLVKRFHKYNIDIIMRKKIFWHNRYRLLIHCFKKMTYDKRILVLIRVCYLTFMFNVSNSKLYYIGYVSQHFFFI